MTSLLELFCDVDDFCKEYESYYQQKLITNGQIKRKRKRSLTTSEIMTILIAFHQSNYRTFKAYYCEKVSQYWQNEFPNLVSYSRFIQYIPSVTIYLSVFLKTRCFGTCTGISFVDSTPLVVCKNQRIKQHKVFSQIAQRGKSSTGWFYGFKFHVVTNDQGEILNMKVTPGNVDDRKPVPDLLKMVSGRVFADRGYISTKLSHYLRNHHGIHFVTKLRSNMKNQLMLLSDRILLRKRAIIETIIDQLKNISQIEHSRHRSFNNFIVNVLCSVIAYCRKPIKPSLHRDQFLAFAS